MKTDIRTRLKSIPFRTLNYIMAGITLVISVILLVSTFRTAEGYTALKKATDDYMEWQPCAADMQKGSDILTNEVRTFVETGERKYLDNYFNESKNSQKRDKALEKIHEEFGDSDDTYRDLKRAMNESLSLMQTEYTAMRLRIEADGGDLSEYPEEIANADTSAYEPLSPDEKRNKALDLVFDEYYQTSKDVIEILTDRCLEKLVDVTKVRQTESSEKLRELLLNEQVLIMALIAIVLIIVSLTAIQVIRPLLTAIPRIKADQPIPVKGASEFRFLAQTYNQMYETNRERKQQLAYAAAHDPLTGAYNRSGFDMLMKNLDFSNAALLLIDIDYFKAVNDNGGHEIGDRVLVRVTELLRSGFRSDDHLCRIGGDEFALFMQNAPESTKDIIADKIESINKRLGLTGGELPPTSISVGVAFGTESGAGDIFTRADKALYVTKEKGRRGCTFYSEQ